MPAAMLAIDSSELVERLVFFAPIVWRAGGARVDGASAGAWYPLGVEAQRQRFVQDVPTGHAPVIDDRDFERWASGYLGSEPQSTATSVPTVRIPAGPAVDILAAWGGELPYDPARIQVPLCVIRGEGTRCAPTPMPAGYGTRLSARRSSARSSSAKAPTCCTCRRDDVRSTVREPLHGGVRGPGRVFWHHDLGEEVPAHPGSGREHEEYQHQVCNQQRPPVAPRPRRAFRDRYGRGVHAVAGYRPSRCRIEPLSEPQARAAGAALAAGNGEDIVDAVGVVTALARRDLVLTSDPDDLRAYRLGDWRRLGFARRLVVGANSAVRIGIHQGPAPTAGRSGWL
jgi:hypothetical protein